MSIEKYLPRIVDLINPMDIPVVNLGLANFIEELIGNLFYDQLQQDSSVPGDQKFVSLNLILFKEIGINVYLEQEQRCFLTLQKMLS